MNILAIDTSSAYLSLAVMKDGRIAGRFHRKAAMKHSSILVPSIDKVLKKARLGIKDVDVFAISVGPGSFTGLRIGVTTVKGLAYSLAKKIVAVPTLDVIANNVKNFHGIICPVLDARKNKVYSSIYRSRGKIIKRISRFLLLPPEELKKKLAKYDKIFFLGDITGSKAWFPLAEIVAELALNEIKNKHFVKPEDLEPMYLYSRECDIKGK
ncbi:MAG: tRNA (adenosine(37)-N6)-threonylcarbamoyltransferase complex dimerization subunit type 1 TsaB [Candidatus Omnitrophica bacterium]|nr:tRNA (adenosine(37)-N6)-threonylcarbamoyltransferase complex dimerization subunit type 1 TsaB [Candidatus Omnitrophota bacterium]